jgi:hypothetical protein
MTAQQPPMTRETAIAYYTELMRSVDVPYLELVPDGSCSEDDHLLVSTGTLEMWAQYHELEFVWSHDTKSWSLKSIEQGYDEIMNTLHKDADGFYTLDHGERIHVSVEDAFEQITGESYDVLTECPYCGHMHRKEDVEACPSKLKQVQ